MMSRGGVRDLSYPLGAEDVARIVRLSVPTRAGVNSISCDHSLDSNASNGSIVAIGAFDGVHLGHRLLLESCVLEASESDARSVVVTFDPDPSEVVAPNGAERRLLSIEDRIAFARSMGVDDVLVISFDREFAALAPAEFVTYLSEHLGPMKSLHVGENFHFGAHGAGGVHTLDELGRERGFSVTAHPLLFDGDVPVSSTRIRQMLQHGEVAEAARMLGRHHFVRGAVARGRGEGTAFGFPTANVVCDSRTCMPGEGVYACLVTDGESAWPAAVNVGKPPTFTDDRDESFLEANLIGFEGDLYGHELAVVFLEWLRASRPFDTLEELERVVLGNIDWVRTNVGDTRVEVAP